MKTSSFPFAALFLLAGVSTARNTLRLREMAGPPKREVKVGLVMSIPGLEDSGNPTSKDITVVENAIMMAYNKVYKDADFEMVDAHVTDVSPDGKNAGSLDLTFPRIRDFYLFTWVGCNLCGRGNDDDDDLFYEETSEVAVSDFSGAFGKMKAVEKIFCRILAKDSKDKYFEKTHDCSLRFRQEAGDENALSSPETTGAVEEDEKGGPKREVEVGLVVSIPGLEDSGNPTSKDITVVENAIMMAYNKVYKDADFEMVDAHVTDVSPDDKNVGSPDLTFPRIRDFYLFTWVGCNLCGRGNDDDDDLFYEEASEVAVSDFSGAFGKMKAVEKIFCRILAKDSKDKYFEKTRDCSIEVRRQTMNGLEATSIA